MNSTTVIYEILDHMKECVISGWELQNMVVEKSGRHPYPSTVLQKARDYADITGATFECVDSQLSKYHFIPGFGMGKASILDKRI